MRDAGYVVAGFVLTAGTVSAYAWTLRSRLRALRRTEPGPPAGSPS
jgi:hypothetical protein